MAGSVSISVTPELDPYVPAQEVRVTMTVRDVVGALADPGALTLKVLRPDGTELVLTYAAAQIARDSVGVFHYDLLLSSSFAWRLRAESAGPTAATEAEVPVSDSPFVDDLPPVPLPGAGNEGRIARVTGGVYVPYAGAADEQPLVWRVGTGWVSQALNLAAAAAISGLLALTHITPGTPGQVLGTPSTGTVGWVDPSSLTVGAGGGPGEVQYNNGGVLDGAGNIKVVSAESEFAFNGTAATGGMLNAPHNRTLARGRNGAGTGNVDIFTWGAATDSFWIGDSSGLAASALLLKTGGSHTINVNGTPEYVFDSSQLAWNGNNSVGAGFYSGTGIVSAIGLLRGSHGFGGGLVSGRNFANSADADFLRWGVDANDTVTLGTNIVVLNVYYRAATEHRWHVASGQVASLTSSALALAATNLTFTSGFASWTTASAGSSTVGGSGLLRFTGTPGVIIGARNYNNTGNINVLSLSGDGSTFNDVRLGDVTATGNNFLYLQAKSFLQVVINNVDEYDFSSAALAMNGNNLVMGGGFVQFSGNAAAQGEVRFSPSAGAHGLWWRNNANTADINVLFSGTDDVVYLGDPNNSVGMNLRVKAGGSLQVLVGATPEYQLDATSLTMNGNNLIGAGFVSASGTVAGSGLFRGTNNVVLVAARNAANSADITVLATDGSNVIHIGDVLGGAFNHIALNPSAGTLSLDALNVLMGSGVTTWGAQANAAATGINRIVHNMTGGWLTGRNNAGTLDIKLLEWGVVGTDIFSVGPTANGKLQFTNVNTGFFGATPAAKGTVTGSKGANVALASLLTTLAGYGLLTDSST
jgi:hypothetical protein